MRGLIRSILIVPFCMILIAPVSRAYTFNDPINTAINTLRNTIMQAQWVEDLALALDRFNELKTQTVEMFRVHSGVDDIIDLVVGDPIKGFLKNSSSLKELFSEAGLLNPQIEFLDGGATPQDIQIALHAITGDVPRTEAYSYLTFEESQVIDAFYLAQHIRKSGKETRSAASQIETQAKSASPKGAARLQAQGVAQLMVLEQQNQEVLAKMLELQATQIEQETRDEKRSERQKLKFLNDATSFADGIAKLYQGGAG